ncbi:MAG: DUF5329 domain-containing protein [Planctomycetota bacterium]|nr:DUF5329 domain-containing protein [Planctomycetota bacterium]
MWRVSEVVRRIEETVVSVSTDVKQVTQTAANMSKRVDEIAVKLDRLETATKEKLHLDEARHLKDEVKSLIDDEADRNLPAEARKEIEYLLEKVKASGLKFTYDDHVRSASYYYAKLYAKYKIYAHTLDSAEDFIERVATRSVGGNPYSVIDGETRTPLNKWLAKHLQEARRQER